MIVPVTTLDSPSPLSSGTFVVPGSLSGSLDHGRNTRNETAHLEDDEEIGKTVAEGGGEGEFEGGGGGKVEGGDKVEGEDEIEELDVTTVGGPVISGLASGSPVESGQ